MARYKGDLRPAYSDLQARMPGHPACRGWMALAYAIARVFDPAGKSSISVPGLQRDLGGEVREGFHFVKARYLRGFKAALGLDDFGVADAILLEPDPVRRGEALDAAFASDPFGLLLAQARRGDGFAINLADLSSAARLSILGPNRGRVAIRAANADAGIPIGTTFRFGLVLPWPGYVCLLNRDPDMFSLEGEDCRPVYSLDRDAGCVGMLLPAGASILAGEMQMDPPLGPTTTIAVLAREPHRYKWDARAATVIPREHLSCFAAELAARGPDRFSVARLDYRVVPATGA